jgi:hypothetical protein
MLGHKFRGDFFVSAMPDGGEQQNSTTISQLILDAAPQYSRPGVGDVSVFMWGEGNAAYGGDRGDVAYTVIFR